jgi:hypothetical protein
LAKLGQYSYFANFLFVGWPVNIGWDAQNYFMSPPMEESLADALTE